VGHDVGVTFNLEPRFLTRASRSGSTSPSPAPTASS